MRCWLGWGSAAALVCALAFGCGGPKPDEPAKTVQPATLTLRVKGKPPRAATAENRHNFGTMDQNKTGQHAFEIRNEGEGELDIRITASSCGCTGVKVGDVTYEKKEGRSSAPPPTQIIQVEPGGTVDAEVTWDTENRVGKFSTTVTLTTNDPKQPTIQLGIEGEILAYIELSDTQVRIEEARNGAVSTASIHVFSKKLDDFELTGFKSSSPLITVEFEPDEESFISVRNLKSSHKATIHVQPGMPIGPFSATVTLLTNCPDRPEFNVSISGQVTGDVILTPEEQVDFKIVKVHEGSTRVLFVKIRGDSAVEVKVARVIPDFLKVTLTGSETRKNMYTLKIEVPPGTPPGGGFKGGVELETTHATAKQVKIPVRGTVTQ